MTDSYKVGYSVDALDDLREIYSYIANELLVPETATAQLGHIRKEVRSLDFMPARYALADWEQNIVSLCSNCHNMLHYGASYKEVLHELYVQRSELLKQIGIVVSFEQLVSYY